MQLMNQVAVAEHPALEASPDLDLQCDLVKSLGLPGLAAYQLIGRGLKFGLQSW